ncbi:MAG: hypothetical protein IT429_21645 [Gemmataceae bacterium]|nr:hypothetical protein [Gemmataceae bacterium]
MSDRAPDWLDLCRALLQEPTCWPPSVTLDQPLPVLWALTVARPPVGAVAQGGEEMTPERALAIANAARRKKGEPEFASYGELRRFHGLEE